MLRLFAHLPRRLLMRLVRGYQLIISPHLQANCRYTPSCSNYAMQALLKYGAVKGTILAVWRVLRCNPWGSHGYDPPRDKVDKDAQRAFANAVYPLVVECVGDAEAAQVP